MTYRDDEEQMRARERRHQEEVEAQERAEARARREAAEALAAQLAQEEQERAQEELERAKEDWRTRYTDRPRQAKREPSKPWEPYRASPPRHPWRELMRSELAIHFYVMLAAVFGWALYELLFS